MSEVIIRFALCERHAKDFEFSAVARMHGKFEKLYVRESDPKFQSLREGAQFRICAVPGCNSDDDAPLKHFHTMIPIKVRDTAEQTA